MGSRGVGKPSSSESGEVAYKSWQRAYEAGYGSNVFAKPLWGKTYPITLDPKFAALHESKLIRSQELTAVLLHDHKKSPHRGPNALRGARNECN